MNDYNRETYRSMMDMVVNIRMAIDDLEAELRLSRACGCDCLYVRSAIHTLKEAKNTGDDLLYRINRA